VHLDSFVKAGGMSQDVGYEIGIWYKVNK
jgi:hypothetical protein